jgi:chorismate dehydratase
MEKPLIAASTYLNSAPLCYSFIFGSQRDLCEFVPNTAPSTCTELLRDGEVDAALIPTIDYQKLPDLFIVPGASVAAFGEVRSVLLVSRKPLEQIRSVALDTQSRTSAALTKVLFEHFYSRRLRYIPWQPNLDEMLEVADAALMIGDPALVIRFSRSDLQIHDYAWLWRQMTGLPMVFAFWAVRKERAGQLAAINFEAAKREGRENLAQLVERYSRQLALPADFLRGYLAECVSYDLGGKEIEGLHRFFGLARQIGLIQEIRPLSFLPTTM